MSGTAIGGGSRLRSFSSDIPDWLISNLAGEGPDQIRQRRTSGIVMGKARSGGTLGRQFPITCCQTLQHRPCLGRLRSSSQSTHFCGLPHQLLCGKSGKATRFVSFHDTARGQPRRNSLKPRWLQFGKTHYALHASRRRWRGELPVVLRRRSAPLAPFVSHAARQSETSGVATTARLQAHALRRARSCQPRRPHTEIDCVKTGSRGRHRKSRSGLASSSAMLSALILRLSLATRCDSSASSLAAS